MLGRVRSSRANHARHSEGPSKARQSEKIEQSEARRNEIEPSEARQSEGEPNEARQSEIGPSDARQRES